MPIEISFEERDLLIRAALAASQRAYAPHSRFPVGAALLTPDKSIIRGCNVENDSYGLAICAERVAIYNAVTQGKQNFRAIAVASPGGVTPCGACRQVLCQFCTELAILIVDSNDETPQLKGEYALSQLLPSVFGLDGTTRIE